VERVERRSPISLCWRHGDGVKRVKNFFGVERTHGLIAAASACEGFAASKNDFHRRGLASDWRAMRRAGRLLRAWTVGSSPLEKVRTESVLRQPYTYPSLTLLIRSALSHFLSLLG